MFIYKSFIKIFFFIITLSFLPGCSNDKENYNVALDDNDVQRAAPSHLSVNNNSNCAIDADCPAGRFCFQEQCAYECVADSDCDKGETCDLRGNCLDSKGASTVNELITDISIVTPPASIYSITAGQGSIKVEIVLDKELPASGLAYTIKRNDEDWDGKIYKAFGKKSVVLSIPVGKASLSEPKDTRSRVDVTVNSGLGTFKLSLYPAVSINGSYSGNVKMKKFGSTGLPIDFKIVTKPDDVTLEKADKAWLLLDIDSKKLFSPIEEFKDAPQYLYSELVYDNFVKKWVATFNNEFRLGNKSILNPKKNGQIGRVMRFEIEPSGDDKITGKMSDRWKGFYDALSAEGVVELVDVVFNGELEMQRNGNAPSNKKLSKIEPMVPAVPKLIDLPPLDQCQKEGYKFTSKSASINGVDYSCSISTAKDFKNLAIDDQISCAIAEAENALSEYTTARMIADFLDDSVPNPKDMTFTEFMESCASGSNGICVPSKAVLCARQLTAYASRVQTYESAESSLLVELHQKTTREAYLGRLLAAFKTDYDTRLTWLETTDYPAIVTSAVKNKIADLLQEWQSGVLDVQFDVLEGYLDPSGLAVLSRSSTDKSANDARRRLIQEIIQGWRGTMDALTLASSRWDRLFQDNKSRTEKSNYVVTKMFDLYLAAGVLTNLSRDMDAGYMSTAFGSGFSSLMHSFNALSRSFDDLIFARDAEVVVSTSLDPQNTNANKLLLLHDSAKNELVKAGTNISNVLSKAQEQALNEKQLRNSMNNDIEQLRSELIETCGLPVGCNLNDARTDSACRVKIKPGECGFLINKNDNSYENISDESLSTSNAGSAILKIQDAALNVKIASAQLDAFKKRTRLELDTLTAFSNDVIKWNSVRLKGLEDLQKLFDKENIIGAKGLDDLRNTINQKARTRSKQISMMKQNIKLWNTIRVSGATTDFAVQMGISAIGFGADSLRDSGDFAIGMGEAIGEAITADPGGSGKSAAMIAGQIGGFALKMGANVLDFVGNGVANGLELSQNLREAKLENMHESADLDGAISERKISEIEEQLEMNDALRENEIETLHQIYDVARKQRAAELAYAEDMDTLRKRRKEFLQMLLEKSELELRVERSVLGMQQRVSDYLKICQSAQLQSAKLVDLEEQRNNVNELIGSPGVLFAFANKLDQAESSLQRAKDKMMDWLVGLEYYAVRPFIDQRVQIMLSVNAYQLEKIFAQLEQIEQKCGGNINEETSVISLKDDILGVEFTIDNAVTSEPLSPAKRFFQILKEGLVSVDKRIRYSSDSNVGELMSSEKQVLAGTFNIGLDDFSNLSSTCNAKVISIAVQLIGKIGDVSPTVAILYDGTSRLRSCQPGISDYINLIGPELTNFGETTLFRTPGRAIFPVAGINRFRSGDSANVSLGGLPLASQYTVLIDTGDNSKIKWENLEDIKLKVKYSYQDLFPEGQCEL